MSAIDSDEFRAICTEVMAPQDARPAGKAYV